MRILVGALRALACILLFLLIVTPLAQIIMRGVFNVPMAGAEEMARYFLICLSFLAGAATSPSMAVRSGWRNSRRCCRRTRAGCCSS